MGKGKKKKPQNVARIATLAVSSNGFLETVNSPSWRSLFIKGHCCHIPSGGAKSYVWSRSKGSCPKGWLVLWNCEDKPLWPLFFLVQAVRPLGRQDTVEGTGSVLRAAASGNSLGPATPRHSSTMGLTIETGFSFFFK